MVLVFLVIYTMTSSLEPITQYTCRTGSETDTLIADQSIKYAEFHNVNKGETISFIRHSSPAPETMLILALD